MARDDKINKRPGAFRTFGEIGFQVLYPRSRNRAYQDSQTQTETKESLVFCPPELEHVNLGSLAILLNMHSGVLSPNLAANICNSQCHRGRVKTSKLVYAPTYHWAPCITRNRSLKYPLD